MLRERTDRSRMKHLRHPTRKQSGLFFQPKSPYGVDCWRKTFYRLYALHCYDINSVIAVKKGSKKEAVKQRRHRTTNQASANC